MRTRIIVLALSLTALGGCLRPHPITIIKEPPVEIERPFIPADG